MGFNYEDSSIKSSETQRRPPLEYSLTKLSSQSIFLNLISFKHLPGSTIIQKFVTGLVCLGNIGNLYHQFTQLATINDIQFKHVFVTFQRSIFAVCFIAISFGPFYIDLDRFCNRFDSIWLGIIVNQGAFSESLISIEIKKLRREFFIMLAMGTIMLFGFATLTVVYSIGIVRSTIFYISIVYTLYLNIGYIFTLKLAVCLLRVSYRSIEKRLEGCTISGANLGHIRLCRQSHNQLIQLTDLIAITFKHVFSAYICLFIPQFVFGFYQLADSSQPILINIISVGWNCVNFLDVLSLSDALVQLNTLPQSYYLTLYLTSFADVVDDIVKLEIRHYLSFVANKDVGFKLWGNFLVNNELLPKLSALVFSYLTAVAGFLQ